MALVTSFLLCVLALVCSVRGSALRELSILHSYPEPGNYSYAELVCLVIDSYPSPSVVIGATFQLNGTDIRDIGIIQTDNGTVQLLLTQEMEGFFTCSKNGSVSNNSVGLAAEPSNSNYTDPIIHKVELPDQFSTVSRLLQCDIKPGVLLQRYLFYWIMPQDSNYTYNMSSYELALNITYALNGSQYQCVVKVDHDGTFSGFYYGTPVEIIVSSQIIISYDKSGGILISILLAVILILILLGIVLFIIKRWKLRRRTFPSLPSLKTHNLATEVSRLQFTKESTLELPTILQMYNPETTPQHLPSHNSVQDSAVPLQHSPVNIPSDMERIRFEPTPQNRYIDDANEFSLEIQEGTIPEGQDIPTILSGVALFGSFKFPDGLRPVSPVFWICVSENPNFQFSKPVTITIPHFLDLDTDDIQSLGLTFLKASHNKNSEGLYEFQPADGETDFETFKTHGILTTTHFCSLCIACRDTPQVLEKTKFCITAVLPKSTITGGQTAKAIFYITFMNLKTCLERVDELISKEELSEYEILREPFYFNTNDARRAALTIDFVKPSNGFIGIRGKRKILRSDVDFFTRDRVTKKELRDIEEKGLYPPRFRVYLQCSQEHAALGVGEIMIKGTKGDDLKYDTGFENLRADFKQKSLGIKDLFQVKAKLIDGAVKWKDIGLALGLEYPQLEAIRTNNSDSADCLTAMLKEWLNRAYDTTEHREPSWHRLREAVRHKAGGNNPSLADEIPYSETFSSIYVRQAEEGHHTHMCTDC